MRSSFAVVGVLGAMALSACSISTTDNSITFKTVPEFVDPNQPAKTSTADWNGEEITINNDGVNPLTGNGGVEIVADPSATKITASAVFAARADTEAEAKLSIADAIGTFQLDETGGKFSVRCAHGGEHGTSKVAASGCKLLRVTVPAGTADKPVSIVIGSGNGGIRVNGALTVQSLKIDENGVGDVSVNVNPVAGATVIVTGENEVRVGLPANFSAERVVLTVNESDPAEAAARINTTDFPGLEINKPYPTTGATEGAAREINVQSKGLLDTVTLARF